MKKINSFISSNINLIILIFLYAQPFLDILTAISINYLNIDLTIGSITRLLFLMFSIYYLLFINKNRNKINMLYLFSVLIYFVLFSINILINKDINVFFYEFKNLLNTYYICIEIIFLYNVYKNDIKININHFIYIYLIYIIFIIIPNILGIGFNSYSHSKLGNVGLFISANAVGNTLCILLPFVIHYILNKNNNLFIKLLIIISSIYSFLTIGTKVPVLGMLVVISFILLYYFIKWIKNKDHIKYITTIIIAILISIISIIVVPKTSFYKNLEIHRKFLGFDSYTEIFTDYDLVDKFIFSERLTFLKNTNKSYKSSSRMEKILGIGYIENYKKSNESTKTIEIDYFEVFYRHGILGFIIYFVGIIYILVFGIKEILKNKSFINYLYFISIILVLLLSLFSGHILVTPCVSIFVSFILITLINKNLSTN